MKNNNIKILDFNFDNGSREEENGTFTLEVNNENEYFIENIRYFPNKNEINEERLVFELAQNLNEEDFQLIISLEINNILDYLTSKIK